MEETPNVNNLNGIPNFGHGLPDGVPEEAVIAADPEAALADEVVVPSEPVEVEITNQETQE